MGNIRTNLIEIVDTLHFHINSPVDINNEEMDVLNGNCANYYNIPFSLHGLLELICF